MEDKKKQEAQEAVKDEKAVDEIVDVDLSLKKDEKDSESLLLINQQALQSQYIEKLEKLLSKDDVTDQDIKNVEFCKAELLAQFLGVISFSSTLSNTDGRKKAADVLSSHLAKLYSKATKLKEKLARKADLGVLGNDVMETKFGASKPDVVTDDMLAGRDLKKVCILLAGGFAMIFSNPTYREAAMNPSAETRSKALAMVKAQNATQNSGTGTLFSVLTDLVSSPEKRLTAQLPDLLDEFNQKVVGEDRNQFTNWAESLVTGLSNLGGKNSILNALQGKDMSKIMGNLMGSKNIA